MEWQSILQKARKAKEDFDRSYKCLNIDRPIKEETVRQHMQILFTSLEKTRVLFNVHYKRLTAPHQAAAEAFFLDLKTRIFKIATKRAITVELPNSLHESEPYTLNFKTNIINMTQTIIEFLNTASKLVTDFDGKSENLRSFIDSLYLLNTIKGENEQTAVSLIKTKLKGNARNLISNESTIIEIINKLNNSVKGESVEVLTAKIMSTRQNNKTANAYCSEIENLTKSLESAYISDGLSCDLATRYSTQVAVKALTKNCTIDKVKLIMEAGQFSSMNDAISKFVNSCTEATGQQNAVLYYKQRQGNQTSSNFPRNQTKFRRRNNYFRSNNNGNNNRNNNSRNNNYNNRYRQRFNDNRRNNKYVRATESNEIDSEN